MADSLSSLVNSLKTYEEDIKTLLKLNDPLFSVIEGYLADMQLLVGKLDGSPSFSKLKDEWVSRLDSLEQEVQVWANYNKLKDELPELKFYIQALLDATPTGKQSIDKPFDKIQKVATFFSKTKVGESLPKESFSGRKSSQTNGLGS